MQDTANSFSAAVSYLRTVAQERWLCPEELFFLLYSDPATVAQELLRQSTDFSSGGAWSDGSSKNAPKLLPSSKPLESAIYTHPIHCTRADAAQTDTS
jgi:hypothetical protein